MPKGNSSESSNRTWVKRRGSSPSTITLLRASCSASSPSATTIFSMSSLLHSCYWYTSEARFVESWHVLSAAIREAQELSIHKEPSAGLMSEFEREMRRRVWCVLDTWDWQISTLLSRPMIIDRSDSLVGLPSLKLEGYSPSPLLHMKLQSELIAQLFRRFGVPTNVVSPPDVKEYQGMVESWMDSFPRTYCFDQPDESADHHRPWIILHRHHLRTMTYSMLLDPIRAYLTRPMTAGSSSAELEIRSDGIDYSLRFIDYIYSSFDHVYPTDAKFHYVLFCIFDTAAMLCLALLHNEDMSIPRQDDIVGTIDGAIAMLKRLRNATRTAKTSHDIIVRISQKVTRLSAPKLAYEASRRRQTHRAGEPVLIQPHVSKVSLAATTDSGSAESYFSHSTISAKNGPFISQIPLPSNETDVKPPDVDTPLVYPPPARDGPNDESVLLPTPSFDHVPMPEYSQPVHYFDMTPPTEQMSGPLTFVTISQQQLGYLATLWNWETLNFDFIGPRP